MFPTTSKGPYHARANPALVICVMLFVLAGLGTILFIHAAAPAYSAEVENGTQTGCASRVADTAASGGAAVTFGSGCASGSGSAGASLPISYNLASLSGTLRYVATNGSDSNGNGSSNAPYATLAHAYSAAAAGDSIVVRGGTYHQGNLNIAASKPVKIIAYPGEIPVFDGSQQLSSGWTTEGNLKYHAYTPRPVTDAYGISFTSGQNLNSGGLGKYPDQAWAGGTQLQQVGAKTSVTGSSFWVDQANNRLYVTAANADSGTMAASAINKFMYIQGAGTVLEGLRVTRYSDTASDYGVITIVQTADNTQLRNVDLSDVAFVGVVFVGNSDILSGVSLKNVTITNAGWMGSQSNYTDNLTYDSVKITGSNPFSEFATSPGSGALKATKARYTKILNSTFANNNGNSFWCDQSCYQTDVANSTFTDNNGSAVFYEISDDLLFVNNYVRASGGNRAVKLAGSSGLKLVNNTIIGGADPVGVYTDDRSKPVCADPSQPLCADSYSSDRDSVRARPATLDWIPRIDMMLDNIIAYPTASGYCGGTTALCITLSNVSASVALNTIIHHADSLRPQTVMNGNVYANGSGKIIVAGSGGYTSTSSFASAMAGSPVGISGFEAQGLYGNNYVASDGSPTAALSAMHSQAAPVPTDARINAYVAAGTRHYGVLNK